MDSKPIGIELYRLPKEPITPHKANTQSRELYFLGPINLEWLMKASKCSGRSLAVALTLLHEGRIRFTSRVKVKPSLLRKFGVDRFAQYRGLKALERAGLIKVEESKRGMAPIIELVGQIPPGKSWSKS